MDNRFQAAVEALTGSPVRSQYSAPGSPRSRIPDVIAVAPAAYNTINKWAQGISDTYALGVLAEQTGRGLPIVVLPFVNSALASRAPFKQSVKSLRAEREHPARPRSYRRRRLAALQEHSRQRHQG
ncbi:MAG: flavoprotein [Actinomycetia bacterium]|nr:flavoprotein [Actinomycetes bacterium]